MKSLSYAKRLFQVIGLLAGVFLISEHYAAYGIWEIGDIIGHETLGFILIGLFGLWILKDVKFKVKSWKENKEEIETYLKEMGVYGRRKRRDK